MKLTTERLKQIIKEELKNVLSEEPEGTKELSDYIGLYAPGVLRVFHYTPKGGHSEQDSMVVDPEMFGKQRYTMRDVNASGYKRSYWYVDLENTEGMVTSGHGGLFYADIPGNKIYDWQNDPEGMHKKHKHPQYSFLQWDNFFEDIRQNYVGTYHRLGYRASGEPTVMTFDKIKAIKTTKEEQDAILSGNKQ